MNQPFEPVYAKQTQFPKTQNEHNLLFKKGLRNEIQLTALAKQTHSNPIAEFIRSSRCFYYLTRGYLPYFRQSVKIPGKVAAVACSLWYVVFRM
jgi:hypothetical protein